MPDSSHDWLGARERPRLAERRAERLGAGEQTAPAAGQREAAEEGSVALGKSRALPLPTDTVHFVRLRGRVVSFEYMERCGPSYFYPATAANDNDRFESWFGAGGKREWYVCIEGRNLWKLYRYYGRRRLEIMHEVDRARDTSAEDDPAVYRITIERAEGGEPDGAARSRAAAEG